MRNSLKKRLFVHLYSILVISCIFALVQKTQPFYCSCVVFLLILQEKFRLRSLTKVDQNEWIIIFFVYS
jgi:hypothetical protein